jgi:hypothetical protein
MGLFGGMSGRNRLLMRTFCLSDFLFARLFFFVFMGRVGKYPSLKLQNMLEDAFATIKSDG